MIELPKIKPPRFDLRNTKQKYKPKAPHPVFKKPSLKK